MAARCSARRIRPGDVFRLADRVGNFVTVKVPSDCQENAPGRRPPRRPSRTGRVVSDRQRRPVRVRLDHPLIQARHVAVRRDSSGVLWLEDRGTPPGRTSMATVYGGRNVPAWATSFRSAPYSARIGPSALEPLEQVAGVDVRVHAARVDAPGSSHRACPHAARQRVAPARPRQHDRGGRAERRRKDHADGAAVRAVTAAAGSVSYNGVDLTQCRQAYAALMGYVPQEDIVHGDLTVTEALDYQARLRLGRGSTTCGQGRSH